MRETQQQQNTTSFTKYLKKGSLKNPGLDLDSFSLSTLLFFWGGEALTFQIPIQFMQISPQWPLLQSVAYSKPAKSDVPEPKAALPSGFTAL